MRRVQKKYTFLQMALMISLGLLFSSFNQELSYKHSEIKNNKAKQNTPKEYFGVSLSPLILQGYNSNLVYAYERKGNQSYGSFRNRILEGQMITPNKYWAPGFRLGLIWDTPYDDWDVLADWTYYYNKSITDRTFSDSILLTNNANDVNGFLSYWATPLTEISTSIGQTFNGGPFLDLQGVWQLNYNLLNLEVKKTISPSSFLHIRPNIGVQNGWIHQKIAVLYSRSLALSLNRQPRDQLAQLTNKFWGIGIKAGLESQWDLGMGLSLIGNVGTSLLWGRTVARRVQGTNLLGKGEFLRIYNIYNKIYHFAPSLQTAFGLEWSSSFATSLKELVVALSWETNYWWEQFHFLLPAQLGGQGTLATELYASYPAMNGALYLQGINIKV